MAMALINAGGAIALWLLVTTGAFVSQLPTSPTPLALSLLFFNNLNVFIAACEIILGTNIAWIRRDYQALRAKYRGNEWGACVAYLAAPLGASQLFDRRTWSRMWSTYALYDPSYQNQESFGFFIDFGNGLSTIPPSLMVNFAIVWPEKASPLWVGCIGLAIYWQVLYGAVIYILSYLFNKRYEGKSLLEVCLFVGVSNCLWIVFPAMGIYACFCMLRDGDFEVFQRQ
ncbi:hypothetical protein ACHAWF_004852 [Thalassiosira exigua]